jgi:RecA-family ATPase
MTQAQNTPQPTPAKPAANDPLKASQVKLEQIDYIWNDRFPKGSITVLAGPSGKGKSMVTAKIAADVTRGRGMPKGKGRAVLFGNLEDAKTISRGRIEAADGDLDHVRMVSYRIPAEIADMEHDIRRFDVGLVILDTAAKHIDAPIRNDQKVAQAMTPLQAMCERTGVVVILVTHTLKSVSRQADPMLAIGGAVGGLTGTARSVCLFGINPEDNDQRALAFVKNSYGPTQPGMTFSIETVELYDDNGKVAQLTAALCVEEKEADVNAIDLVASKTKEGDNGETKPEKRAEAAEWLTKKLADGPVAASDLDTEREQEGIAKATLRRAAEEIGLEKPREGFGKGSVVYWRLPFGHPALNPAVSNKTPGGK